MLDDAIIELNDDLFIIYLNNALGNDPDSPRGRFSIAHELGHFFIDEHRLAITQKRMPSLGDYSDQDLEIEREADLFASRLLLPKDQFARAIKKVDKGLEGIRELANKFRVSIKCAALRYLSEEPMPCALIFRSIDGSVKWKLFSKGMWNAGFRSIVEEPVAGGATQLCIKGKEADWTSAPASYLFRLPDQCHANVVFIEDLREKYQEVFGETARTRNKQFLRKRISWRIQAMEEGDLSERAPANEVEAFVVDTIRSMGQDTKLQQSVVDEVMRDARERSTKLESERKSTFRKLEELSFEIKTAVQNDDSIRLRNLREQSGAAEEKLNRIIEDARRLEAERFNENEIREAMADFDPCWNQMVPREKTRLLELIIEKILVDSEAGKLAVQFRPSGIKALIQGGKA